MSQEVTVKDIKMNFGSMVVFMIKWAIASIPAAIILGIVGWVIALMFAGVIEGMMSVPH